MPVESKNFAISVIIPTWNAADMLKKSIPALLAQVGAPEFEILIIDNGVVNDDSEILVKAFQDSRLRYFDYSKQLGYAGAVNEGVRVARHDLIAVMNNDNIADSFWLKELAVVYASEKANGRECIVTANVSRPDFAAPEKAIFNLWGRIVEPQGGRDPAIPHFHPDGSSFLFSKAVFGEPYDEDYFIYHEDVAFGWSAWLRGFSVAKAMNAKASTFDGGSTKRIAYRTAYFTEKNRWKNYIYFLQFSTLVKVMPLLLLDALAKLLLKKQRKARLLAYLDLLVELPELWKRRANWQRQRKKADHEILPLISCSYFSANAVLAPANHLSRAYCWLLGLNFSR